MSGRIGSSGHPYVGVEFARGICGVSVVRSGEAMESALRECCQGIKIGKILIQRRGPVVAAAAAGRGNDAPNCTAAPPAVDGSGGQATAATASTSQQQAQPLIYEKLPSDIAGRYVLLMDPVLGTGISACAAVQVRGSRCTRTLHVCC